MRWIGAREDCSLIIKDHLIDLLDDPEMIYLYSTVTKRLYKGKPNQAPVIDQSHLPYGELPPLLRTNLLLMGLL